MKSHPTTFMIADYSVALMESSGGHCIIIFVFFLFGMQHNLALVSRQNPQSLQNSRLVQRVAKAN